VRVDASGGGDVRADTAALAARATQVARGGARAAVLGVSDGLVTNICLILGIAGAQASARDVRLAGIASLIAGAVSMAAGEWVSVRSQVELFRGVLDDLRRLVARNPRLVLDELAGHLERTGFGRDTARLAATELPLDEPRFLRFTALQLFGVNTDELGSPMTAAVASMSLFAVGALVPLAPWFFTSGGVATGLSLGLAAVAGVVVGAYVSRSGGRPIHTGALRQLSIVVVSASVTFGIGRIFGTVV
jgi:VIT1/CCC1 family predicted Fe2+/Mn2+ transporter